MKKIFLLIIFAYVMQTTVMSQQCLPNGIIFTTQMQIDSFQINYPNCTQIGGYMLVAGYDISNFDSLIILTSVGGGISINGGPLGGNPLLNDLSGLDSLTYIGGDLNVEFNENLSSLTGLEKVTYVGGNMKITKNTDLTDLTGLDNLDAIGGDMEIWGNNMLIGLSGLENLNSIGGDLRLSGYMATILFGNPSLTNLLALENLSSIGGNMDIRKNSVLISLNGLGNINSGSIANLLIYENGMLSTCEVESICDYLANPNGSIEIHDNNTGCNNQEEVEHACTVAVPGINAEPEITIHPNPAKNDLFISNEKGVAINEVIIYNQLGQNVLQPNIKSNKVDISRLEQGIYIVVLTSNKLKIRKKLVIKK